VQLWQAFGFSWAVMVESPLVDFAGLVAMFSRDNALADYTWLLRIPQFSLSPILCAYWLHGVHVDDRAQLTDHPTRAERYL